MFFWFDLILLSIFRNGPLYMCLSCCHNDINKLVRNQDHDFSSYLNTSVARFAFRRKKRKILLPPCQNTFVSFSFLYNLVVQRPQAALKLIPVRGGNWSDCCWLQSFDASNSVFNPLMISFSNLYFFSLPMKMSLKMVLKPLLVKTNNINNNIHSSLLMHQDSLITETIRLIRQDIPFDNSPVTSFFMGLEIIYGNFRSITFTRMKWGCQIWTSLNLHSVPSWGRGKFSLF